MKSNTMLIIFASLILAIGNLPTVQAVTDAELEAFFLIVQLGGKGIEKNGIK